MAKGDFKKARGVLPPGALALHRAASGKVDCPIHGNDSVGMVCTKCEHTVAEQLEQRDKEWRLQLQKKLLEHDKQLADKERELEDSKNEIFNINAQAQDIACDISRINQQLTAANAVVEAGDAFRNCPNSEEVVKRMTEFFKVLAEHKLKRRG